MAIFGTFWDRALTTRAGDAQTGVVFSTLAHSLPATNPEILMPVLRSIQDLTHIPGVSVLALRGNASLNTWGLRFSSTASAPTVELELVAATLHSIIR